MNPELKRLITSIEPTDKLIGLNKEYQKLSDLHDGFEAFKDKVDDLTSAQAKSLGLTASELKTLEAIEDKLFKRLRAITVEAHEHSGLMKIGKAIIAMKSLE